MGMRPPTVRVDADAVCAQCGTVNPEDTLICKVCGNNLRDQRAARLVGGGVVEAPPEVTERRRWLGGVLAVIGLILVAVVLMNLRTIEAGLVEILAGPTGPDLGLWSGAPGAVLDDLAEELASSPLAEDERHDAVMQPIGSTGYVGRFVLAIEDPEVGLHPIGEAVVRLEDGVYYFVGRAGATEVRGTAYENNNGFLVADWGRAGFRIGAQEHEVRGAAGPRDGGGFACYGESDEFEHGFNFLAFSVLRSPVS